MQCSFTKLSCAVNELDQSAVFFLVVVENKKADGNVPTGFFHF